MDIYDRAQQLELAEREHLLEQRRRRQCDAAELAARECCAQCGEPIPAARRRALPHVQHCIECARRREAAARLGRLNNTNEASGNEA